MVILNNIEFFIVVNLTIISLGILSYYLNSYSNSGIYFGVRIPKKFKDTEEIKSIEKEYKMLVLMLFSILILIMNIVAFFYINSKEEILESIFGFATLLAILINYIIFVKYNIKLKKLKEDKNWNYKSNNVVVVDTSLRKPKKNEKYKALNDWVFLVPIILPFTVLVLTYLRKKDLVNLGFWEIYRIPIIGILMCLFMFFLAKISLKSKVDLNSSNIESTIINKKKIKRLISIFFLITEVEITLLYSIIQLGIIYNFYTEKLLSYINIFIAISMAIFIFIFILIGSKERVTKENENQEEVYKDDDKNWIFGMFYYNKNDPAFMIEKRVGIGYTINFANKISLILLVLMILFITLMSFL